MTRPLPSSPPRATRRTFFWLAGGAVLALAGGRALWKSRLGAPSANTQVVLDFVEATKRKGIELKLPRDIDRLNGLINRQSAPRGFFIDHAQDSPYFTAQLLPGAQHADFPNDPTFPFPALFSDAPMQPHWVIADDAPLPPHSRGVSSQEGGGMIWLSRRNAAENLAGMRAYFGSPTKPRLQGPALDLYEIGAALFQQSAALYARAPAAAPQDTFLQMSGYHEMEHLYALDYLPPSINAAVNHLQGGSLRETRTTQRSCITQAVELLADLGSLRRALRGTPTAETDQLLISLFQKNNYTGELPQGRLLVDAVTLCPAVILSAASPAGESELRFDYDRLRSLTETLARQCRDFLVEVDREVLRPHFADYFKSEGVAESVEVIEAREIARYQRERKMGAAEAGLGFWTEYLAMLNGTPRYAKLCVAPIETYTMNAGVTELHRRLLGTLGLKVATGDELRTKIVGLLRK